MALTRSTIGRVKISSAVIPAENITFSTSADVRPALHSALLMPTGQMVDGAGTPTVRFNTFFDIANDTFGLGINEYDTTDTVEAYIAKLAGSSIASGSVHTMYSMPSNFTATAYIDSFSVAEGGHAVASCVIHFFSDDGDNKPYDDSQTESFPALSAIPELHGIGPLTINGSGLPGVTSVDYASGLSISFQRHDGHAYAVGGTPSGFTPTLTVGIVDPVGAEVVLNAVGVTIGSTTTVELYKFTNDVLSGTGKKTVTIASGYVAPGDASGQHGADYTGSLVIHGTSSDGSTHPFVVS